MRESIRLVIEPIKHQVVYNRAAAAFLLRTGTCMEVNTSVGQGVWAAPDRAAADAQLRPALGRAAQRPALRPTASGVPIGAFCVTVYNETEEIFRSTIASLLFSLRHFYANDRNPHLAVVCIVVDGGDGADPGLLKSLRDYGLIVPGARTLFGGVERYSTEHRIEVLLESLTGTRVETHIGPSHDVRVTVLLKLRNRGKLHSHYLFFGRFCRSVRPRYCFQIDVGTTLAHEAVLRMIRSLEREPELAAVAPRVIPPPPALSEGYLAEWQYLDFAYRAAISWPFEVTTGFLSVVPGQAGVFRWKSLRKERARAVESKTAARPLGAYFRGMRAARPIDRIMYLAEDRIIGAAVVLNGVREWRLGYLPSAAAITDSCRSFRELLRQRRRWNNSSLSCRYWLVGRWNAFTRARGRNPGASSRLRVAIVAQVLVGVQELFLPAQLFALCLVLAEAVRPTQNLPVWVVHAFWVTLAAEVILTALSARGSRVLASRAYAIVRPVIGLTAGGLFFAQMSAVLSPIATFILFSPGLAVIAMAPLMPAGKLTTATRAHLFPFTSQLMSNVLLTYGLWNLHDVSWGTKGLTESTQTPRLRRQMRRLRNGVLAVWILLNVCACLLAVQTFGRPQTSLNVVTEVSRGFELVQILVAFGFLVMERRRFRPRAD
jgi:chitin synthase